MIQNLIAITLICLSIAEIDTKGLKFHGEPVQGQSLFTPTLSDADGAAPPTGASEVGRFGSAELRSDCAYFIRFYAWDSCPSKPREQRIAEKSCSGSSDTKGEWEYSHWYCYVLDQKKPDGSVEAVDTPISSLIHNFINSAKNDGCPANPAGAGLGDDCQGYVDQSMGYTKGGKALSNAIGASTGTDPLLQDVMTHLGKTAHSGEIIRIFWVCHDWITQDYPWMKEGFDTTANPPQTTQYVPTVFGVLAFIIIGGGAYLMVERKRKSNYEDIYSIADI